MAGIFDILKPDQGPGQGIGGAMRQGIRSFSDILAQGLPNALMDDEDLSFGQAVALGFGANISEPDRQREAARAQQRQEMLQALPMIMPMLRQENQEELASSLFGTEGLDFEDTLNPMQQQEYSAMEQILQTSDESGPRINAYMGMMNILGKDGEEQAKKMFPRELNELALDIIREKMQDGKASFESLETQEKQIIRMAGLDPTDPLVLARSQNRGKALTAGESLLDKMQLASLENIVEAKRLSKETGGKPINEYLDASDIAIGRELKVLADEENLPQALNAVATALEKADLAGKPELVQQLSTLQGSLIDNAAVSLNPPPPRGSDARTSQDEKANPPPSGISNQSDAVNWLVVQAQDDPSFLIREGIRNPDDFLAALRIMVDDSSLYGKAHTWQLDEEKALEDWEAMEKVFIILPDHLARMLPSPAMQQLAIDRIEEMRAQRGFVSEGNKRQIIKRILKEDKMARESNRPEQQANTSLPVLPGSFQQ